MPEKDYTEAERLRGAIREALTYADRDDGSEVMAKVWSTLYFALEPAPKRERSITETLVDELSKDDLWQLVGALMAEGRDDDAWKESVNKSRRVDRQLREQAELKCDKAVATLKRVKKLAESWRCNCGGPSPEGHHEAHCDAWFGDALRDALKEAKDD